MRPPMVLLFIMTQMADEFVVGVVESLSYLRGGTSPAWVGRMQVRVVTFDQPSPGLPNRVEGGPVGQFQVGVVARQRRVLRCGADRVGRRSLRRRSGGVVDEPAAGVSWSRGQPSRELAPEQEGNAAKK